MDRERGEKGERADPAEVPADEATKRSEDVEHTSLGRFQPRRPMGGRWIGILAFALVVLSLVLHEVVGVAPALVADVAGLYAGKRGLDSRGRGFATVALIAGIAFLIFYTIMVIVGEEAFTPPDASAFFG